MYEKISETAIRQSKINALKTKIRKEIEKYTSSIRENMKILLKQEIINTEMWDYCVNVAFFLTQLTEFVDWEGAFQNKEAENPNEDIVVYTISIDEIDIWLQENFNFVSHLLSVIEHDNGFANIAGYLDDRFLSRGLLNIVERTLYEQKQPK
jgi:hypothetical protein